MTAAATLGVTLARHSGFRVFVLHVASYLPLVRLVERGAPRSTLLRRVDGIVVAKLRAVQAALRGGGSSDPPGADDSA